MGYVAEFTGWDELNLSDMLVAYRKAKADLFFENIFPTAVKFAEYEQDLLSNLSALLKKIKADQGFSENSALLGDCRLVPKKLAKKPKTKARKGHAHFSDPDRAFSEIREHNHLTPAFRIVGDFPVDTHVISALWINMVGHKFDACLDNTAYGSRLRRIRNDEYLGRDAEKPFHITAIGSFEPYFQPYQQWRNDGLKAIRGELEKERNVIAVSLDLRSYYHQLDPTAIASRRFQEELGLKGDKALTEPERTFTRELTRFLGDWSDKASGFAKKVYAGSECEVKGGLVISLVASRIVANVLLQKWDRLIREKVTPVHYGRYIDDMFLVIHDPGTIKDSTAFLKFLQARLSEKRIHVSSKKRKGEDGVWEIDLGKKYQKDSVIQLQAEKQKLFVLQGQAGCDLLDSIEKEIHELSSEHRLMPSPDQLEHSTAARVLSAAGSVAEEADTLRRADGLTIQRLSWSLQLRNVETLARDLPRNAWKKEREEFYQFAHNHILRPDTLFAHYSYLPRLLGFAVGQNEWEQAEAIVKRTFEALGNLAKAVPAKQPIEINGTECRAGKKLWNHVHSGMAWALVDAAARYYDPQLLLAEKPSKKVTKLAEIFMAQLWKQVETFDDFLDMPIDAEDFDKKAPLLATCDLARTPYKYILDSKSAPNLLKGNDRKYEKSIFNEFARIGLLDTDTLDDFLRVTRAKRLHRVKKGKRSGESLRPYLFPTRPYTPTEISELAPVCTGVDKRKDESPDAIWARYVRVVKGVWVKPALVGAPPAGQLGELSANGGRCKGRRVCIGNQSRKKVVVAITNLLTTDDMWKASACNKPKLSLHRYKKLSQLVNQAIKLDPKPDYLLLPELSLPLRWVSSIGNRLAAAGISLIAGTEYRHRGAGQIVSEACLQLTDDRLGFPSSARIWQEKREPAVGEERELVSKFGKHWSSVAKGKRTIYVHNGMHFGVLVCSEIQNSKDRISFQGQVDALMVLAWNQDLDTFTSLIEAAALDVHAYTILVNNRKYGDSRVRAPSKESFRRDLARLRGGENDFCVTVELDIEKLRAFQSRTKRWPEETDPFKPVPEGFGINNQRKVCPPK